MTIHFGPVPAGSVLPVHFGSYNAAGASVALTGLAITDVEIYKGITVTQRSSDAGVVLIDTDGIDIDGIAGANGFSIDTGNDTDAGFYTVGSFFNVWVSAVTIDSQTVNFLAATFRLVAAEAVAGYPKVDAEFVVGVAPSTGPELAIEVRDVALDGAAVDSVGEAIATILAASTDNLDGTISGIPAAILAVQVDGDGTTLGEILRLLYAGDGGDWTLDPVTGVFVLRNPANTKNRVEAIVTPIARTVGNVDTSA